MHHHQIAAGILIICATLSGCTNIASQARLTPDFPTPAGAPQRVFPTPEIRLAAVYRTAVPLRDNGLPELREICTEDFVQTPALASIRAAYANPTGKPGLNEQVNLTEQARLGVGGINLFFVSASASANPIARVDASFTGVEVQALSGEDAEIVRSKLGANCNSLITQWRNQGHGVYVVLAAYKAADVRLSFAFSEALQGQVGVSVVGLTPDISGSSSSSSTETLSGNNLYYKIATIF
jgi:hypothetical protein